jgi:hypothetical protein
VRCRRWANSLGAVFIDEARMTQSLELAGRFDAVAFVRETTGARPLPSPLGTSSC